MIKQYTALCLIVIPIHISTADNSTARKIPEIFFIDQDNTVRMQTIQEGMERLKQEIRQETSATLSRHKQEHDTQQEKMKREHEENIKNHSRSFIVRLKENAIALDQQLAEAKEKSDQQSHLIKEALNSSATYQLIELNLKNSKIELEKLELLRKCLYGVTAFSQLAVIITGYTNASWSLGGSLTLFNGMIFGYGYYITDDSNTKQKISNLKTILIRLQPATENEEDEAIKDNTEEIDA
jgi:hypothetical protein